MSEMSEKKPEVSGYRRRKIGEYQCHCCKEKKPYCLSCTCGFMICEACFQENLWGMSNGPTWICPDCERIHMT